MEWVCVLDMASLQVSRTFDKSVALLRSASGEVLVRLDVPPLLDDRHVASRLYDKALSDTRLARLIDGSTVLCPVGLYNPYSTQVAVKGLSKTEVYELGPLSLGEDGHMVRLDDGELTFDGVSLKAVAASPDTVAAACGTHPD